MAIAWSGPSLDGDKWLGIKRLEQGKQARRGGNHSMSRISSWFFPEWSEAARDHKPAVARPIPANEIKGPGEKREASSCS